MSSSHKGVECDVCNVQSITGVRHYCLICHQYDLCEVCYQERRVNKQHRSFHPTQPIPSELGCRERVSQTALGEEAIYVCPYCGDKEFNPAGLFKHCKRYHFNDSYPVRCPICPVHKSGPTRLLSTPLLAHLLELHKELCAQSSSNGPSTSCSEGTECSICMEIVPSTSNGRSLPCSHRFHSTCIDRWLENNQTCPVCRTLAVAIPTIVDMLEALHRYR